MKAKRDICQPCMILLLYINNVLWINNIHQPYMSHCYYRSLKRMYSIHHIYTTTWTIDTPLAFLSLWHHSYLCDVITTFMPRYTTIIREFYPRLLDNKVWNREESENKVWKRKENRDRKTSLLLATKGRQGTAPRILYSERFSPKPH